MSDEIETIEQCKTVRMCVSVVSVCVLLLLSGISSCVYYTGISTLPLEVQKEQQKHLERLEAIRQGWPEAWVYCTFYYNGRYPCEIPEELEDVKRSGNSGDTTSDPSRNLSLEKRE